MSRRIVVGYEIKFSTIRYKLKRLGDPESINLDQSGHGSGAGQKTGLMSKPTQNKNVTKGKNRVYKP